MAIGFGSLAPLARNMLAMLDGEITTARQQTAQFVTRISPESTPKPPAPLKSAVTPEPPERTQPVRPQPESGNQTAQSGAGVTATPKIRGGQIDIRV